MEKTCCCNVSSVKQQLSEETIQRRRKLFSQHVEPYVNMIYKLCIKYTSDSDNVQENYTEVLTNMYKYIETYDTTKSIRTWLHIVTKRCVFDLDKRRYRANKQNYDKSIEDFSDAEYCDEIAQEANISANSMGVDNWRTLYNDDIVKAIEELKPIHRDALILQQAGYSLVEIADIEYLKGTLKVKNIETIKSRLYIARQNLQNVLTRDGERKKNNQENQGVIH